MPRKGENIYRRKDLRWEARYIWEHRADGSACYGYCYGKTYREVKQKVAEARIQHKSACRNPAQIQLKDFSCFCEEWLQLSRTRVKESTYVKYRSVLDKYILPRFGDSRIEAISSVNIEQFGYDIMNKNGLSGKTVRDILTILHSVVQNSFDPQSVYDHRVGNIRYRNLACVVLGHR